MRRRGDALDIDDVLQRIGHPVKRPAPVSGGDLGLGRARRGQSPLGRHRDEGVELAVVPLDLTQQRLRVFDRRQFLGADQLGGLGDAEEGEVAAHGVSPFAR